MNANILYITNAQIVNEGKIFLGNVFIKDGLIENIFTQKETLGIDISADCIIDASGQYLFPGIIDDQVHFRDPGLTEKADMYTESKAAAAGGVTSFMDMPNTLPKAVTLDILEEKYKLASEKSLINYSFFIGATNTNINEVLKADAYKICGVKIFMGASTGNMLVDNDEALNDFFSKSKLLIATHCEEESIIQENLTFYKNKFGDDLPMKYHPLIRTEEACYQSTFKVVNLAKKHNTRLHVLHLSTAKELDLFDNTKPIREKNITSEVCVHHLWFDESDYEKYGSLVKCNPAIKTKKDKEELLAGLLSNKIDIIATDHAPHLLYEKSNVYTKSPSGIPLIQHSFLMMLELYHLGKISLEKIAEKMCHAPAECYKISKRGFVRKGYAADIILVDLNNPWKVENDSILYKCKWSPFENFTFKSKVISTIINGKLVYNKGKFNEEIKGQRLLFEK